MRSERRRRWLKRRMEWHQHLQRRDWGAIYHGLP